MVADHEAMEAGASDVDPSADLASALGELLPLRQDLDWTARVDATAVARRIMSVLRLFPELAAVVPPDELARAVVRGAPKDASCALRSRAVHIAAILDPEGPFRFELLTNGGSPIGGQEYLGLLRAWLASKPDVAHLNSLMRTLQASRPVADMADVFDILVEAVSPAPSCTTMMLGMLAEAAGGGDALALTQRGVSLARLRTLLDRQAWKAAPGEAGGSGAALVWRYDRLRRLLRPPGGDNPVAPARGLPRQRFVSWAAFCASVDGLAIRASCLATAYAKYDHARGTLSSNRHSGQAFCHGPYIALDQGEYSATFVGSVRNRLAAEFAVEALVAGQAHRLCAVSGIFEPMDGTGTLVALDFEVAFAGALMEFKIWLPTQEAWFELSYVSVARR